MTHFKTIEKKFFLYFNSSEIQRMALIIYINFLSFPRADSLFRCPKTLGGKFYGNLFGCLPLETLNLKRL